VGGCGLGEGERGVEQGDQATGRGERDPARLAHASGELRRYARTINVRLADVAREVTDGRLDTTLLPRT
jgi:hypothetical protein